MICIRDFCLWCRVANTHHVIVGELWGVETCEATEVTPSQTRLRDETSYVAKIPGLGMDAAEFKLMSRKSYRAVTWESGGIWARKRWVLKQEKAKKKV